MPALGISARKARSRLHCRLPDHRLACGGRLVGTVDTHVFGQRRELVSGKSANWPVKSVSKRGAELSRAQCQFGAAVKKMDLPQIKADGESLAGFVHALGVEAGHYAMAGRAQMHVGLGAHRLGDVHR